jgi:hypothetical protein
LSHVTGFDGRDRPAPDGFGRRQRGQVVSVFRLDQPQELRVRAGGCARGGDMPEQIAEPLTRFATGVAYVMVSAEDEPQP